MAKIYVLSIYGLYDDKTTRRAFNSQANAKKVMDSIDSEQYLTDLFELELEKTGKVAKKLKTELPPDFWVSDAVMAWATRNGYGVEVLQTHLEHFKDSCTTNGYSYLDWDAAFRNAIRTNWARIPNDGRGTKTDGIPF